ncbi:DNA cytosine methyltransferase [Halomonas sp. KM-1]|uniref:DNA cytosine methyltransferase n=1 Tax=Halomonas sp. KM-1 TaxID=590061 RepID=UPI000288131B|nr:DNA cytosine methyltransferase [Halomonas sp. KM-1]
MKTNKPTVIDLFAGCGGFGLGAELAGFETSVAIDIEEKLQSSYRVNFPSTTTVLSDLSDMGAYAWDYLLGKIKVDGVIGGPPCQGFSRIGRRNINDPRRQLIHHFFRTINIIRPKFFVMENVLGLLDNNNYESVENSLGILEGFYKIIGPLVVDAKDFGAATSRKRVILVGYDPNEMSEIDDGDLLGESYEKVNVKHAISDLPSPIKQGKKTNSYGWGKYRECHTSPYANAMKSLPPERLGSPLAIDMLKQGYVSGLFETSHSQQVVKRFNMTLPGETEKISRYPRLSWDGLCPTLRAGTGSDRGNFQAMRPIHPFEPRVITVREAARLQGFPDWFLFHPTKHHSFRMIGNSVSPVLSKAILGKLKEKL